jgi:protein TonB
MFEEVMKRVAGQRAAQRASWLMVSTVAQVLLAIGVVSLYRATAVREKRERAVDVKFVKGAARPAMPPPPRAPVPATRKKPPREPPRETPRPLPALIQPKDVPEEIQPHDPDEARAPDEEGSDEGIVGGVVGGEEDGTGGAQPTPTQEFNEASMTRPVFVSGPDLAYTRRALEREVEGLMIVKCVVTVEGAVRACQVLKGLPYMDDAVVAALERRRYEPARLNGRPVEVKYVFRINLRLPQ